MSAQNDIFFRRGTSSNWSSVNPTLRSAELGYDTTEKKFKIGDGTTPWNSLDWASNIGVSGEVIFPESLHDVSGIFLDTSFGPVDQVEGQINWNNETGTIDVGLTPDLTMHVGQDIFFRVKNSTGSTITKGEPVAVTGVSGGGEVVQAAPFAVDGSIDEVRFIGLVADDIANGEDGYVVNFGHVKNVDLRTTNTTLNPNGETWAVGDILFVDDSSAGGLTKVQPKDDIYVAMVLEDGQNGELLVRITDPGHINELHDVNTSGISDNNFLVWNSGNEEFQASSGLYYVDGQLGVGTASPNAVLHAYGSTPSGTVFNVEGTNGSLFSVVDNLSGVLMSVNNNAGLPVFEVNDDDSIVGGRFAQNDFVVTTSGDIGMGTANPTSKLEVNGTVTATTIVKSGGTSSQFLKADGTVDSTSYTSCTGTVTGTGTTNQISYWTSATNQGALSTSTYPSLTELSYVKGATSSIQTQLNSKTSCTGTVTGTGTANQLSYWTSASNQGTLSTATYPSLTELSYVKGVTSSIQTQLNTKTTCTGTVTSVAAGNGLNFSTITGAGSVTLGTPESTTLESTNSVTTTSHTHAFVPGGTTAQYIRGDGTLATLPTYTVNNGTLTMNVSGTGLSGSASFTANQSGNSTFTVTSNATSANTVSTIVARDSSGNFSAGTITATQVNVDNLCLDGNTLSSKNTDGNVIITPNGTGGIAAGASATVTGQYAVVGGGGSNTANAAYSTVGGGFGNTASAGYGIGYTHVGGGCCNTASGYINGYSTVGGGQSNSALGDHATIGGGLLNCTASNSYYATIGGGYFNKAASCSTVSGGFTNCALGTCATVGGGHCNTSNCTGSTIGGGAINTNSGIYATISGGYSNKVCATNSSISGGRQNFVNARHGSINGGHYNVIQSPFGECSARGATIGGGVGHNTSGGTVNGTTGDITGAVNCCSVGRFSTIAGGFRNCTTGGFSVVGGGHSNTASSYYSTVSGGYSNTACGVSSTVGGGSGNIASGNISTVSGGGGGFGPNIASGNRSTVGGGANNCATANNATVAGGMGNTACGFDSTVSGGRCNTASGNYSSIAGGKSNTDSGCCNVHILGSNITATAADTTYTENLHVTCALKINKFDHTNLSVASSFADTDVLVAVIDPTGTPSTETLQGSVLRSSLLNQPAQLQFRQGTDAERQAITPASGEPIWTTDNKEIWVGDGTTCGGLRMGPSMHKVGTGTGSINTVKGGSTSSGFYSTVNGGRNNTASAYGSTVGGGAYNCSTNPFTTVSGGNSNTASSYYSTIGGGGGNCASNYYATINGGIYNRACGIAAIVAGGYGNTASGYYATIGGGQNNFATGNASIISGGFSNCAGGQCAAVNGGTSNSATGNYSMIAGGHSNCSCGLYSAVGGGFFGKASRYGEVAHASGRFAQNGDAQHSIFVLRKNTVNTTTTELFLDSYFRRITLTAETTWTFDIKLSAYNDTDNTAAWWIIRGGIRRDAANNTSLIGSLIEERDYEGTMSGTSAAVTADDTNESLKIAVTGLASKNIRWVAVVDVAQVSWGTP